LAAFSGKRLADRGHPFLAPDSNGLRVLVRLGLVREPKSYARTYAEAREVAAGLPKDFPSLQAAHLLLQIHGQTLCRRANPRCDICPLAAVCVTAVSSSAEL
jgi:endonuclease III